MLGLPKEFCHCNKNPTVGLFSVLHLDRIWKRQQKSKTHSTELLQSLLRVTVRLRATVRAIRYSNSKPLVGVLEVLHLQMGQDHGRVRQSRRVLLGRRRSYMELIQNHGTIAEDHDGLERKSIMVHCLHGDRCRSKILALHRRKPLYDTRETRSPHQIRQPRPALMTILTEIIKGTRHPLDREPLPW